MSMKVYIDMEMPKSCSDCPMLDWDLDYIKCKVTKRHFKVKEEPFRARRVDDCPLVSVPEPHGRLIDASEKIRVQMYDDMTEDYHIAEMTIDDLLSQGWVEADAPTIIPASEEGE
jgi:hypothetical protein